jgi:hypothetical protein
LNAFLESGFSKFGREPTEKHSGCLAAMGSHERESSQARIKKLRERAHELRAAATAISNPRARKSMLNIAKTYDNAADLLERLSARE